MGIYVYLGFRLTRVGLVRGTPFDRQRVEQPERQDPGRGHPEEPHGVQQRHVRAADSRVADSREERLHAQVHDHRQHLAEKKKKETRVRTQRKIGGRA